MYFVLKKILAAFLNPSALILLCLFSGLFFLTVKRRFRSAVILISCGIFIGLAAFLPVIPGALLRGLEKQYAPYSSVADPAPKWILVLGQGSKETDVPESSRVNGIMYSRLMEAIRIQREAGAPQLIVSLSGVTSGNVKSGWWKFFCKNVMVPTSPEAILLTEANDTQAEITQALQYIQKDTFILVTSAAHMPRAMKIALAYGGNPVAAPCDYQLSGRRQIYQNFIPAAQNMVKMELALHEYLGLVWFYLNPRTGS